MIDLKFADQVITVKKIRDEDFSPLHHEILDQLQYQPHTLLFSDDRWRCIYLGAGEEKAVYCVCDHDQRVFAIELIDERHYLNGRFVGGKYFFNKRISSLANIKASPDSEFGLTFSGLFKIREFVHGYEWARFQFDPRKKTGIDIFLTSFLQSLLMTRFREYQARYKDVHDRNVLFEIRNRNQSGIPIILKTWRGYLRVAKIGLQPIDVR